MKLTTILVAASVVFSSVVLAFPVEAESAAAVRSILEARKCAYSGCSACHEYCWRGKCYVKSHILEWEYGNKNIQRTNNHLDMPCAPDHDCSIQRAGCILLYKSTGCCCN